MVRGSVLNSHFEVKHQFTLVCPKSKLVGPSGFSSLYMNVIRFVLFMYTGARVCPGRELASSIDSSDRVQG